MGTAPRMAGGGRKFDTYSFSWWTDGNGALTFFSCVSAKGKVSSIGQTPLANVTLDGGEYVKIKTVKTAYDSKFAIIAKKACKVSVFSSLKAAGTTTPTNTYKMAAGDTVEIAAELYNTIVIKAGSV